MTPSRPEIPAVWVLVPLLLVAVPAVLRRLRARAPLTWPRVATGLLACAYAACLVDAVLLPLPVGPRPGAGDLPWHAWVNLVPLGSGDPAGLWLNLVLFVPLGVLLPLLVPGLRTRGVVLAGALVSLAVELVQLVAGLAVGGGRVSDVDDLLANTLGALVGGVLVRGAVRVSALARVVAACTWPPAAVAGAEGATTAA
ncbi:VanZ family protein [Cellulomonas sp. 179-A 9B4 NHS]|uniref:VanZ family protein n=1 Tax=Cellulomonas sp. 179-A 9B4 NHS TaxID=3142379 RepID=UPI0039A03124